MGEVFLYVNYVAIMLFKNGCIYFINSINIFMDMKYSKLNRKWMAENEWNGMEQNSTELYNMKKKIEKRKNEIDKQVYV